MSKSKYVDTAAIMQVIGAIYIQPSLLDNENYHFHEEDFSDNEFHVTLFGTIYNLHALGAKEITLNAIEDYLAQRPKRQAIYKANKGAEYLEQLKEATQLSAFQYYYDRVKKMTLLRMYNERCGMDLSWLYDMDNIFDAKKKQAQEDWLDNTPLVEIADLIDKKIEDVKSVYVDNCEADIVQAGDGVDLLIEQLKKAPDIGYPLYGKYINTIFRGARLSKFYARSAATNVGKALPNSTIIPTPSGDKKVGDIQVGDYIFDAFGKPTMVKAIYPQGKKEVWEVEFKDGRKARCCNEHLWSFCTEGQRIESKKARKFQTKTLSEISQMPLTKPGHGYNILVPMQKAVEYSAQEFYLKPYTLGLLLGGGSFRYSERNKALTFSSENEILPSYIAKEMGWKYKSCSDFNYNWTFEWDDGKNEHINVWVEEALQKYSALWNVKSENKFIPQEYLRGSIEQRLDLLNGLLDSDGSVEKERGQVSFWTISERLKNGIIELCHGLGFKTGVTKDTHKENLCYRIEIIGTPEDKSRLFKLPRKKEIIMEWYNSPKRKELNLFNPIIAISNLNYEEEMTCFYVDNNEHLFLMNDYIVTHNTRAMIGDACFIGCGFMYNLETKEWDNIGEPQSTLFIATEQSLKEVQQMMLAFISGVNEDHIATGLYEEGEEKRVWRAAEILREGKIFFESIPDFSLQDVENIIKKGIREYDTKYVFFDYLQTSLTILEEITRRSGGIKIREDNVLFMMSTRLKDLCNKYGVFILTSTQLNSNYQEAEVYDQNLLRGAKAIADKLDCGSILLEVSKKDEDSLAELCRRGGFPMPNVKMAVYKNRATRWKNILVWMNADRGICRFEPMFVTDYKYELINMEDFKINVKKSVDLSAF